MLIEFIFISIEKYFLGYKIRKGTNEALDSLEEWNRHLRHAGAS